MPPSMHGDGQHGSDRAPPSGCSGGKRPGGRLPSETLHGLLHFLREEIRDVLGLTGLPPQEAGLLALGARSLDLEELRARLNGKLGRSLQLSATDLLDHPSASVLAKHLFRRESRSRDRSQPADGSGQGEAVAIVGMACQFPGGDGLNGFGGLLRSGDEAVQEGEPGSGIGRVGKLFDVALPLPDARRYGAFVGQVDRFDAAFFGISEAEARLMDPQHRLLLEASWHALEHAGISPDSLRGTRAGVFAGIGGNGYRELLPEENATSVWAVTGTSPSAAIGRVAFSLGLMGPAIAVDTASSSSLVAVHQAVRSLLAGDADVALAGGANVIASGKRTEAFLAGGMLSPDGHCRSYDADARGYVRGEGCGVVVLKPLRAALEAGDRVLAVIRASAVNQDGASSGLTAPRGPAQARLIEEALAAADWEPSDVDYLEGHGSGTPLGDPVEVEAALSVYGRGRDHGRPLLLGSVKGNIGHLEAAAGVAGLIKVVLAMRSGRIPAQVNFQQPNPRIQWEKLPVQVVKEATSWPRERMRAGVSSFGLSGTNAHVLLEGRSTPEGPPATAEAEDGQLVLPLSAATPRALSLLAIRYRAWLRDHPAKSPRDLAWTATVGRGHLAVRAGVVFRNRSELSTGLRAVETGELGMPAEVCPEAAFLFPGQEDHWEGMGTAFYRSAACVREVLDDCDTVFADEVGDRLLPAIFGEASPADDQQARARTAPALYALGCALAAFWRASGLRPAAVLGHGAGEIAAAHVAGMVDLADGMHFAIKLGRLVASERSAGAMGAVYLSAAEAADRIPELRGGGDASGLAIASDNGGHQVLSGPGEVLTPVMRRLESSGIRTVALGGRGLSDRALADPIFDAIETAARGMEMRAGSVPFVSSMTGKVVKGPEDLAGPYWRRQARDPLQFAIAVATLSKLGIRVLVDLGPRGRTALTASSAWPGGESAPIAVPSLRGTASEGECAAGALARAWAAGAKVSLTSLYGERPGRRVSGPLYPFEGGRYWADSGSTADVSREPQEEAGLPLLEGGGSTRERARRIESFLVREIQQLCRLDAPPSPSSGFFDLGMESLAVIELRNRLNRVLDGASQVTEAEMFSHPSPSSLAKHVAGQLVASPQASPAAISSRPPARRGSREPIAVVGLSCRFPGGGGPERFWRHLEAGEDLVTKGRPGDDLLGLDGRKSDRWGAYVPHLDRFDAEFFRIAPVEAELLDPQQRLLLEVTWEALEDAGIAPSSLKGSRTGVYAGMFASDYQALVSDAAPSLYRSTGSSFSAAIGRIAFTLGLQGPAIAVDTACSASLAALHQAVAGLERGDVDLALAGGVNAIVTPGLTESFDAAGMLAQDGKCKTFDASADGYVRGEGCGMLALMRLSRARAGAHRVWGLILGSAVNQDGASAGFTAPNGEAQVRLIREALARAGIEPASVDYLEAHGTGTPLGDPIELEAAAEAYGRDRDPQRPLMVGSVKTNIGHLEAAAGVAGVIKVLLAMRNRVIPRHLHFSKPNPRVDWAELPLSVVEQETPWTDREGRPRRAAVSSFGYAGTNAHVVLEAPREPSPPDGATARKVRLLPLSGQSPAAVRELAALYRDSLGARETEGAWLADAAWTAAVGRDHFQSRAGLAFSDGAGLKGQLEALAMAPEGRIGPGRQRGKVAFLFTGQGSQWAGMGRELYGGEPVFREVLDECERVFRQERGESLLEVMFGDAERLGRTEWTQPSLCALETALTALWASVGVRPDIVFGHSVGEIPAMVAAGALDLEAALRFAAQRGALMGSLPTGGAMAAVFARRERVVPTLGGALSLGAENGTHQIVSGPEDEVAAVVAKFESAGIRVQRLDTSHAFHSALMDPVLDSLESAVPAASEPSAELVSGLDGRLLNGVPDASYWRRQAREPVLFGPALETLVDRGIGVVVEIGPRAVLGPMAISAWPGPQAPALVASPGGNGGGDFAMAVGAAYEAGLDISFRQLFSGERRRRISLPKYPFQRRSHWARGGGRRLPPSGHPLLGVRRDSRAGGISFETRVAAGNPDWISANQAFGEPLAPAALFVAQVLEALRLTRRASASLDAVEMPSQLSLAAGADRTLQVVLEASGGFEVLSRESGAEAEWDVHVRGRIGNGRSARMPKLDVGRATKSLIPVDLEDAYAHSGSQGMVYASALRRLQALWAGPREALGRVALPAGGDSDALSALSVLLDACFQVASIPSGMTEGGGAWLPRAWDRLQLPYPLPDELLCHARFGELSEDMREADLDLYTVQGEPLGGIRRCTLRPMTRVPLGDAQVEALLHRLVWRKSEPGGLRTAEYLAGPEVISTSARPFDGYLTAEGADPESLDRLVRDLERRARWYALDALDKLGWTRRVGDRIYDDELRRKLGVTGKQQGLFSRLLSLLHDARVVTPVGNRGWLVTSDGSGSEPPEVGAVSIENQLVHRCGSALADVLRDRADPTRLLFEGSPSVSDLPWQSSAHRAAGRMAADAVAVSIAGLPDDRRLQVLEVGAGTGATTDAVLPELPEGRTDYECTDASPGALAEARARFASATARVRYRTLDIEREPVQQGFFHHGYDLVIAANSLHATGDLRKTLVHCHRLLRPSGLLVAVETTAAQPWMDLVFGLSPAWWQFRDEYRPDHALAPRSAWERALLDSGYDEVSIVPGPAELAVIVARAPARVERPSGLWVLSGGAAQQSDLADELQTQGQTVVFGPSGASREQWHSVFEALPDGKPLRGVAHLNTALGTGPDGSTSELCEEMDAVCPSALNMAQGLADADVRPSAGVWFVSRGGQVVRSERSGTLSGAPLWGFARTLAREMPELGVRMLDLDPEGPGELQDLVGELLFPDKEREAAYRDGVRWVPRLVRAGSRDTTAATDRPAQQSGPAADSSGRLARADRTYLIVGGLGSLGRSAARLLGRHGPGAVVLNGRRAPGSEELNTMADLEALGVRVRIELGDVTEPGVAERLVARSGPEGDLPPLGGVIFCAGASRDGVLANQSWARFRRAMWPMMLGAWRLHGATRHLDLDLFALCGAMAGLVGNSGQSGHAAANAFLDQVAQHRRALGLAGQFIAWGAGSQSAGERLGRQVELNLEKIGFGRVSEAQGARALEEALRRKITTVAVGSVDWSVFAARGAPHPLLEELVEAPIPTALEGPEETLIQTVRKAEGPRREALLAEFLQHEVQEILRLPAPPSLDRGFFDLGMDSLTAVEFRGRLSRALGTVWTPPDTVVFDHPNVSALARHLAARLGKERSRPVSRQGSPPRRDEERIAVVGMACRFPGASTPLQFWERLTAEHNAVTLGRPGPAVVEGGTAEWGAYLRDVDRFDAGFFRIAPVEAKMLDPQQRLLLETSWEALEDAGLDPARLRGTGAGVYVGIGANDYQLSLGAKALSFYGLTGNTFATAAGRIAFTFGLEGPALAIDTACSSSLVAVHEASMALQRGESDLVLAAGVNVILASELTAALVRGGAISAEGRCKTFDEAASGYVRGEGCGVVVLKRLADAEAAGDRILGVLLGSAVNQDGASAGLTTPSGPAQTRVIGAALTRAGVPADSVDYLEAHGTGTKLGDPIEVAAAAAAYGRDRPQAQPLLIGSVKTNIGHLEAAAGMAGLIKVLLAMRHRVIPRHLHFETPNPRVSWDQLSVQVVEQARSWPSAGNRPPRAGVSSFGISGTNAHVVLEGYRDADREARPPAGGADEARPLVERRVRLLPLSARSGPALAEIAARYLEWLQQDSNQKSWERLSDAAWTAGTGRSHFPVRAGLLFGDPSGLREQLETLSRGVDRPQTPLAAPSGKVAFLYTGQGSQWMGMGRDLYEREPVFREAMDRCDAAFRAERDASLLSVVFGKAGALDRTEWTQPSLYAVQTALAALWASVGVLPAVVFGHSVGEIAAAYAAGIFDLEAGMRFAARRGSLMGDLPPGGAMAAVFASASQVADSLTGSVSLAADNGAHQVVSGPADEVAAVLSEFEASGIRVHRLQTSHAFHSSLMDPVLGNLEEAVPAADDVSIPLVSGVSGRLLEEPPEQAYWSRQARAPVRFRAAVETLSELGVDIVVEIGPREVLGPMALLAWPGPESPVAVSSLGRNGRDDFASAAAALFEAGADLSFEGLFAGERRRRVALPTYAFQRERHWIAEKKAHGSGSGLSLPGVRKELSGGSVSFEVQVSAREHAWLGDHRVLGEAALPGALFAAQVIEAAGEARREAGVALENVQFQRLMTLGADGGQDVRLVLSPDGRFEVTGRPTEEDPWEIHAEGEVVTARTEVEPAHVEEVFARPDRRSGSSLYERLVSKEIAYGPAFRGVRTVWPGAGEAWGDISLPPEGSMEACAAHPVVLDSCFHVTQAIPELNDDPDGYLPLGWDSLWLRGVLPNRVICHARSRANSEGIWKVDLALYTHEGAPVGGLSGFTLKRASRAERLRSRLAELEYEVRWRAVERPTLRQAEAGESKFVLAGDRGFRSGLARELEGRNQTVLLGPATGDRSTWRSYFESLPGDEAVHGVAYVSGLGADMMDSTGAELAEEVERSCSGALALVQGMRDADVTAPLWCVTRGAQVVDREIGGVLAGACLWGFASVLALEHPDFQPRLVDLDPVDEPSAAVVADELLAPNKETRIAWRGGERHVQRLARAPARRRLPTRGDWQLAPDPGRNLDAPRVVRSSGTALEAGQVRLAVEAAGVNFLDVMVGMGLVDAVETIGAEMCGRVLEAGAESNGLAVGDRVFGVGTGVFGPEAVIPAELTVLAPPGYSAGDLATLPVAFVTAMLAFESSGLRPGDSILVHAGTGGVGQAAIQLARASGLTVYATASPSKWELLGSLGVAGVFNSRDPGFGEEVQSAAGTVSLVLNSLTGEGFIEASLSCLKPGGWFVELGKHGIWSEAEMAAKRPDVRYRIVALDRLMREEPTRVGALVRDLARQLSAGEVKPLTFTRWPLAQAGAAFEYMREARHTGKVVLVPSPLSRGRLRSDRSYLVTGGLGGLGLAVADWLARSGAGAVVLNGRRKPGPAARARLDKIRGQGAEIRVEACDVSDGDAVQAMLSRIEADLPPLGGVIHSAGILSDWVLVNQDWEQFERVLRPKVLGAWQLHKATLGQELDLFVLFSSVSGTIGHPGQANYAAANAFLDQLARHRRALGLAGQAIAWGPWSGAGMAAERRDQVDRQFQEGGIGWISPEEGIETLRRVLHEDPVAPIVARLDWSARQGAPHVPPWLEDLVAPDRAVPSGSELVAQLRGLSASEREGVLRPFVLDQVRDLLGLRSRPSPGTGFFDLGMDSLMAVELRNRLNRALGGEVAVSNTVALDYPNAVELTEHLARAMASNEGPASNRETAAGGTAVEHAPADDERLLNEILDELGDGVE